MRKKQYKQINIYDSAKHIKISDLVDTLKVRFAIVFAIQRKHDIFSFKVRQDGRDVVCVSPEDADLIKTLLAGCWQ